MSYLSQAISQGTISPRGWVLRRDEAKNFSATLETLDAGFFEGDGTAIDVHFSTLNYKDALAITNKGPVIRSWPLIPGIDLAGEALDGPFKGQTVLVNGHGMGEMYHGGLASHAQVPQDWLIPIPKSLTAELAMAVGTAGYTAALCVHKLIDAGIKPEDGPILVTGATGGVGIFAVMLLARKGYEVVASTGRESEKSWLTSLGASEIIARQELSEPGKPLQRERWAGVVDSVGSHTLVNALAQTKSEGSVAACGLAQGGDLNATVMPFILRGVSLLGVNSVTQPHKARVRAWDDIANTLSTEDLKQLYEVRLLDAAQASAEALMANSYKGRMVIQCS